MAVVHALGATHAGGRARELVDLRRHHPLRGEGQELAYQVDIGALLDPLQQRHPLASGVC
jgi:hypothetical protein